MYARAVIWRAHETTGDGAATAAVLFQELLEGGLRLVSAGFDPGALHQELGRIGNYITNALDQMAEPIAGRERLTAVAATVCPDLPVANLLGEIFDVIGADGQIDVRAGKRRDCDREYVEGMHWGGGVLSPLFVAGSPQRRVVLERCAIFISDLDLTEPADLLAIVEQARASGAGALLVTAQRLSDRAIGALVANQDPSRFQAIAVRAPGVGETERFVAMRDLAILTGGRPLARAAGDGAVSATADLFGRARIAWADRDHVGIVGGMGDPRLLRRHVAALRAAHTTEPNPERRNDLCVRIGKLLGGSATLWVGGATESEVETRKALATRAAAVMRGAVAGGVVPGGGAAYLVCRDLLRERLATSTDPGQQAVLRVVIRALEAPTRTIVSNAGGDPDAVLARIGAADPGCAFDARTGCLVSAAEAGLLDPASVAIGAVRSAFGGAAQAMTIDVVVHHRAPTIAMTPA
jgi:chaperonin GroEL